MTLPSSGTISIADINGEFGLGNQLSAYRGARWYTPSNFTGTFSADALSFSDFYNKRKYPPYFDYLIVAGGAAGSFAFQVGGTGGGGGGVSGGLVNLSGASSYTVIVGAGGVMPTFTESVATGTPSYLFQDGRPIVTSTAGIPGQFSTGRPYGYGGSPNGANGGGAGDIGGNGGTGPTSFWNGLVYGSGGGGGGYTAGGSGGLGAGNGGAAYVQGSSAPANQGGGGGGGGWYSGSTYYYGGSGGSGVCIFRYVGPPIASGGSVSQSGGYTFHTFSSSGAFSF